MSATCELHKANARRFALWLMWKIDVQAEIVERALIDRDLTAVDELRDAILRCCPPDYALVLWGWAA